MALPLPRGSDSGHKLTSLPRTEPHFDVPSWRSCSSHGHPPTRHPHLPRAPRPISKHDSPGWGPQPQGVRQDRATLPQYHTPRRYTSPSRQEPVRAPSRRLPWAETAAEVTPCCPPPGDHWGSTPQGSSPLPQIQIHATSSNPYPQGCSMGASSFTTPSRPPLAAPAAPAPRAGGLWRPHPAGCCCCAHVRRCGGGGGGGGGGVGSGVGGVGVWRKSGPRTCS